MTTAQSGYQVQIKLIPFPQNYSIKSLNTSQALSAAAGCAPRLLCHPWEAAATASRSHLQGLHPNTHSYPVCPPSHQPHPQPCLTLSQTCISSASRLLPELTEGEYGPTQNPSEASSNSEPIHVMGPAMTFFGAPSHPPKPAARTPDTTRVGLSLETGAPTAWQNSSSE